MPGINEQYLAAAGPLAKARLAFKNIFLNDNTFKKALRVEGNLTALGMVITPDKGELTISGGAITVTGHNHTIDTESDAANDDLDTINGGSDGQVITLRLENSSRRVTFTTAGNISPPGAMSFVLFGTNQNVTLKYDAELIKWVIISLARPGDVVGHAFYSDATMTSGTAQIPNDDTKPQSGEGLLAISGAYTPTKATNKLRISGQVNGTNTVSNEVYFATLFQDSGVDALQAAANFQGVGSKLITIFFNFEIVAGTVSSTTIKIRFGGEDSATVTLNGQVAARKLGGILAHTLLIEEIET